MGPISVVFSLTSISHSLISLAKSSSNATELSCIARSRSAAATAAVQPVDRCSVGQIRASPAGHPTLEQHVDNNTVGSSQLIAATYGSGVQRSGSCGQSPHTGPLKVFRVLDYGYRADILPAPRNMIATVAVTGGGEWLHRVAQNAAATGHWSESDGKGQHGGQIAWFRV
ncbi:hypothetical protein RRG08_063458 [Elysia crispata]|uniref:Uncharacterized protein n=1 Tax=Elysia crispata TaxID=231223 RepID=A0AAE1DV15_9GAST|nr:hypothetical protein RRG08_063458 [Elysia crispata]